MQVLGGGFHPDPGGISGGNQEGKVTIILSNCPGAGKILKLSICSIIIQIFMLQTFGTDFFKLQNSTCGGISSTATSHWRNFGQMPRDAEHEPEDDLQTPTRHLKDPGRGTDVLNSRCLFSDYQNSCWISSWEPMGHKSWQPQPQGTRAPPHWCLQQLHPSSCTTPSLGPRCYKLILTIEIPAITLNTEFQTIEGNLNLTPRPFAHNIVFYNVCRISQSRSGLGLVTSFGGGHGDASFSAVKDFSRATLSAMQQEGSPWKMPPALQERLRHDTIPNPFTHRSASRWFSKLS